MTVVGHVAALWRYPVKSMAGEELDDAEVSWNGLAGDRGWAFIRGGQVRSGFPVTRRPPLRLDPAATGGWRLPTVLRLAA